MVISEGRSFNGNFDQRQFEKMSQLLKDFEGGLIELSSFTSSMEFLFHALKKVDDRWEDSFLEEMSSLESVNSGVPSNVTEETVEKIVKEAILNLGELVNESLGGGQVRSKLYQGIHKALISEWDPIGVGHFPEAQDEYDSYIPTIYKMLVSNKPKCEIFDYLWWVETEYIGIAGDRQGTEKFTERLMDLYSECRQDDILTHPNSKTIDSVTENQEL